MKETLVGRVGFHSSTQPTDLCYATLPITHYPLPITSYPLPLHLYPLLEKPKAPFTSAKVRSAIVAARSLPSLRTDWR